MKLLEWALDLLGDVDGVDGELVKDEVGWQGPGMLDQPLQHAVVEHLQSLPPFLGTLVSFL